MLRVPAGDDLVLAVHPLGPDPQGIPVLLAHATGFHGRVWEPLARRLDGCSCWAPDLRGHGDSPVAAGHGFDWEGFADDMLTVLDALQLERPVGVGHSKGGAALLLAESRRPGTFERLWLYEPVVFPPVDGTGRPRGAPPENLISGALARRSRFASYEEAEANFAAKPPLDVFDPEVLHEYVMHGFAAEPDGSVVLKCRPEDESRVYQMGAQHDAWQRLDQVACPVTVVRGSISAPGPAFMADPLAARLPAGRLEVHEELGHFGPLQAPESMARSVLACLG